MMRKQVFCVAATIGLVALALVLSTGCGSSSDEDVTTPGPAATSAHGMEPSAEAAEMEITVTAAEFSFVPDEIAVSSGEMVMLTLENKGDVEHDLQVDSLSIDRMDGGDMAEGHEGAGEDALALHTQPGESASITFRTDQTGTFEFYCTIPGHREAGMVGTLTVS